MRKNSMTRHIGFHVRYETDGKGREIARLPTVLNDIYVSQAIGQNKDKRLADD
ncbi:hypothetical protein DPMN_135119 [Dreissena polymorpha]|uniref:Uncharacterized protein n=1 Tax=Dreissena polymorpha TaxID=45954 RepID=A0A9D4JFH6_DREPO|nr:hypothetical protein DPMN_135119 [Dreissena polymorpha]